MKKNDSDDYWSQYFVHFLQMAMHTAVQEFLNSDSSEFHEKSEMHANKIDWKDLMMS